MSNVRPLMREEQCSVEAAVNRSIANAPRQVALIATTSGASCRAPRNAALCHSHSGCYRVGRPRAEAVSLLQPRRPAQTHGLSSRSPARAPTRSSFAWGVRPSAATARVVRHERPVEATTHGCLARPMQLRVAAFRRLTHTVALMSMHVWSSRVGIALLHAGPHRALVNQRSNPSIEML